MATIEVVKGTNGQFRFRIKANNGEIIATGESYKQKQKVMQVLRSLKSAVNGKVVDLSAPKPTAKPAAKKAAKKSSKSTVSKSATKMGKAKSSTKSSSSAKTMPAKPKAKPAKAKSQSRPKLTATTPLAPRQSMANSQIEADEATVMEGSNTDPQTETEMDQTPEVDEAGDANGIT